MITRRHFIIGIGAAALLGTIGCRGQSDGKGAALGPAAITDAHECALCGMFVSEHPGPKGQVRVRGSTDVLLFCSTRELFAWLLQPEAAALVGEVYVHDMERTDWTHPSDAALVDATSAWFVADQPLAGSMGPTLASFERREAADAFAAERGGRVVSYADVDMALISGLAAGGHRPSHGHGGREPHQGG